MTFMSRVLLFIAASVVVANNGWMATTSATMVASMRFPRERHLREDTWLEFEQYEPRLKRWEKENNTVEHDPINMEEHSVQVNDATGNLDFMITKSGFELVDLHPRLLPLLREVKKNGLSGNRVGPTTAGSWIPFLGGGLDETVEDKLARSLQGSNSFTLSSGNNVHYAFRCAGFVIRKGGPEGTKLEGTGFDNVAQRVHIDQDLQGEPLLGMGLTWVFKLPYMRLLNVWSPLHDVRLRPMAFADVRTVSRLKDVVRYRTNSTANAGGRFGSFRSDRLMSLYSPDHKWYWYSNMRFGQAVAFDTGSVPHSSFTLPGEVLLSSVRKDIEDLKTGKGDKNEICSRNIDLTKEKDMSLDMEAFIGSALGFRRKVCENRATGTDIDEMLEFISRASLEIRCVTFLAPTSVVVNAGIVGVATLAGLVFARLRRRNSKSSK